MLKSTISSKYINLIRILRDTRSSSNPVINWFHLLPNIESRKNRLLSYLSEYYSSFHGGVIQFEFENIFINHEKYSFKDFFFQNSMQNSSSTCSLCCAVHYDKPSTFIFIQTILMMENMCSVEMSYGSYE